MADHETRWQFTLKNVSHCQFYVERQMRHPDWYDQDGTWEEQDFSAFPGKVDFFPDGDVSECDITVTLGSALPPFDEAVHVVSVPFHLEDSEGVYFRTVDDCGDGDGYRVNVPSGEYDLVARIYSVKRYREGDDSLLLHCKAAFDFLPKGTTGPRVFKSRSSKLPDRLALHRDDGSLYFVPNE